MLLRVHEQRVAISCLCVCIGALFKNKKCFERSVRGNKRCYVSANNGITIQCSDSGIKDLTDFKEAHLAHAIN